MDETAAYEKKLKELQEYLPFLDSMQARLQSPNPDTTGQVARREQLVKIKSLRSLLLDKDRRMKMHNLLKCENVLMKLSVKLEKATGAGSPIPHIATIDDSSIPLPVPPPTKIIEPNIIKPVVSMNFYKEHTDPLTDKTEEIKEPVNNDTISSNIFSVNEPGNVVPSDLALCRVKLKTVVKMCTEPRPSSSVEPSANVEIEPQTSDNVVSRSEHSVKPQTNTSVQPLSKINTDPHHINVEQLDKTPKPAVAAIDTLEQATRDFISNNEQCLFTRRPTNTHSQQKNETVTGSNVQRSSPSSRKYASERKANYTRILRSPTKDSLSKVSPKERSFDTISSNNSFSPRRPTSRERCARNTHKSPDRYRRDDQKSSYNSKRSPSPRKPRKYDSANVAMDSKRERHKNDTDDRRRDSRRSPSPSKYDRTKYSREFSKMYNKGSLSKRDVVKDKSKAIDSLEISRLNELKNKLVRQLQEENKFDDLTDSSDDSLLTKPSIDKEKKVKEDGEIGESDEEAEKHIEILYSNLSEIFDKDPKKNVNDGRNKSNDTQSLNIRPPNVHNNKVDEKRNVKGDRYKIKDTVPLNTQPPKNVHNNKIDEKTNIKDLVLESLNKYNQLKAKNTTTTNVSLTDDLPMAILKKIMTKKTHDETILGNNIKLNLIDSNKKKPSVESPKKEISNNAPLKYNPQKDIKTVLGSSKPPPTVEEDILQALSNEIKEAKVDSNIFAVSKSTDKSKLSAKKNDSTENNNAQSNIEQKSRRISLETYKEKNNSISSVNSQLSSENIQTTDLTRKYEDHKRFVSSVLTPKERARFTSILDSTVEDTIGDFDSVPKSQDVDHRIRKFPTVITTENLTNYIGPESPDSNSSFLYDRRASPIETESIYESPITDPGKTTVTKQISTHRVSEKDTPKSLRSDNSNVTSPWATPTHRAYEVHNKTNVYAGIPGLTASTIGSNLTGGRLDAGLSIPPSPKPHTPLTTLDVFGKVIDSFTVPDARQGGRTPMREDINCSPSPFGISNEMMNMPNPNFRFPSPAPFYQQKVTSVTNHQEIGARVHTPITGSHLEHAFQDMDARFGGESPRYSAVQSYPALMSPMHNSGNDVRCLPHNIGNVKPLISTSIPSLLNSKFINPMLDSFNSPVYGGNDGSASPAPMFLRDPRERNSGGSFQRSPSIVGPIDAGQLVQRAYMGNVQVGMNYNDMGREMPVQETNINHDTRFNRMNLGPNQGRIVMNEPNMVPVPFVDSASQILGRSLNRETSVGQSFIPDSRFGRDRSPGRLPSGMLENDMVPDRMIRGLSQGKTLNREPSMGRTFIPDIDVRNMGQCQARGFNREPSMGRTLIDTDSRMNRGQSQGRSFNREPSMGRTLNDSDRTYHGNSRAREFNREPSIGRTLVSDTDNRMNRGQSQGRSLNREPSMGRTLNPDGPDIRNMGQCQARGFNREPSMGRTLVDTDSRMNRGQSQGRSLNREPSMGRTLNDSDRTYRGNSRAREFNREPSIGRTLVSDTNNRMNRGISQGRLLNREPSMGRTLYPETIPDRMSVTQNHGMSLNREPSMGRAVAPDREPNIMDRGRSQAKAFDSEASLDRMDRGRSQGRPFAREPSVGRSLIEDSANDRFARGQSRGRTFNRERSVGRSHYSDINVDRNSQVDRSWSSGIINSNMNSKKPIPYSYGVMDSQHGFYDQNVNSFNTTQFSDNSYAVRNRESCYGDVDERTMNQRSVGNSFCQMRNSSRVDDTPTHQTEAYYNQSRQTVDRYAPIIAKQNPKDPRNRRGDSRADDRERRDRTENRDTNKNKPTDSKESDKKNSDKHRDSRRLSDSSNRNKSEHQRSKHSRDDKSSRYKSSQSSKTNDKKKSENSERRSFSSSRSVDSQSMKFKIPKIRKPSIEVVEIIDDQNLKVSVDKVSSTNEIVCEKLTHTLPDVQLHSKEIENAQTASDIEVIGSGKKSKKDKKETCSLIDDKIKTHETSETAQSIRDVRGDAAKRVSQKDDESCIDSTQQIEPDSSSNYVSSTETLPEVNVRRRSGRLNKSLSTRRIKPSDAELDEKLTTSPIKLDDAKLNKNPITLPIELDEKLTPLPINSDDAKLSENPTPLLIMLDDSNLDDNSTPLPIMSNDAKLDDNPTPLPIMSDDAKLVENPTLPIQLDDAKLNENTLPLPVKSDDAKLNENPTPLPIMSDDSKLDDNPTPLPIMLDDAKLVEKPTPLAIKLDDTKLNENSLPLPAKSDSTKLNENPTPLPIKSDDAKSLNFEEMIRSLANVLQDESTRRQVLAVINSKGGDGSTNFASMFEAFTQFKKDDVTPESSEKHETLPLPPEEKNNSTEESATSDVSKNTNVETSPSLKSDLSINEPDESIEAVVSHPSNKKSTKTTKKYTKGNRELIMLQEDLRDMFISQGVMDAENLGFRMCRLTSETGNAKIPAEVAKRKRKPPTAEKSESPKSVKATAIPKKARKKLGPAYDTVNNLNENIFPQVHLEELGTTNKKASFTASDNSKTQRLEIYDYDENNEDVDAFKTFVSPVKHIKSPIERDSEAGNTAGKSAKVIKHVKFCDIITNNPLRKRRFKRGKMKKCVAAKTSSLADMNSSPSKSDEEDSQEIDVEFDTDIAPLAGASDISIKKTKKFMSKKKKRGNWSMGVIKKKRITKIKQTSPITSPVPANSPEKILDKSFDIKSYHFISSSSKYSCVLCHKYNGLDIVAHFKNVHPHSEVMISRLHPGFARLAMTESSDTKQVKSKAPTGELLKYQCRFCERLFTNVTSKTFFSHITRSHTGEYKAKCNVCSRENDLKMIHACNNFSNLPPDLNSDDVFGYICGLCNYTQVSEQNIKNHVSSNHFDEQCEIIKINLSNYIFDNSDAVNDEDDVPNKILTRSKIPRPDVQETISVATSEKRKILSPDQDAKIKKIALDHSMDIQSQPFVVLQKSRPKETHAKSPSILDESAKSNLNKLKNIDNKLIKIKQEIVTPANKDTANEECFIDKDIVMKTEPPELSLGMPLSCDSRCMHRCFVDIGDLQLNRCESRSVHYVCSTGGCKFDTTYFLLITNHIKSIHANDVWDGFCKVCGFQTIVTRTKNNERPTYLDALDHIVAHMNVELAETTKTEPALEVIADKPTPKLQLRPIGDLLAKKSPIVKDTVVQPAATDPESSPDCPISQLCIDNVVSLNPDSPSTSEPRLPEKSKLMVIKYTPTVLSKPGTVVISKQPSGQSQKTSLLKDVLLPVRSQNKIADDGFYRCADVRCSYSSKDPIKFINHVDDHCKLSSQQYECKCCECPFIASSGSDLLTHIVDEHSAKPATSAQDSDDVEVDAIASTVSCPSPVDLQAKGMGQIDGMLPKDSVFPLYKCTADLGDNDNCEKAFLTPQLYLEHLNLEHRAKRLRCHECVCDSPTFIFWTLIYHLRLFHGYSLYACVFCGSSFDIESSAQRHLAFEHPEKRQLVYMRHVDISKKIHVEHILLLDIDPNSIAKSLAKVKLTEKSDKAKMAAVQLQSAMRGVPNLFPILRNSPTEAVELNPKLTVDTTFTSDSPEAISSPNLTPSASLTSLSKTTPSRKITRLSKMAPLSDIALSPTIATSSKIVSLPKSGPSSKMTSLLKIDPSSKITKSPKFTWGTSSAISNFVKIAPHPDTLSPCAVSPTLATLSNIGKSSEIDPARKFAMVSGNTPIPETDQVVNKCLNKLLKDQESSSEKSNSDSGLVPLATQEENDPAIINLDSDDDDNVPLAFTQIKIVSDKKGHKDDPKNDKPSDTGKSESKSPSKNNWSPCDVIELLSDDEASPEKQKKVSNTKNVVPEKEIVEKPKTPILELDKSADNSSKSSGFVGKDLYRCGNIWCGFMGNTSSEFKDHLTICEYAKEHSKLPCYHCKRKFKSNMSLLDHVHNHGVLRYKCGVCEEFKSPSIILLNYHMNRMHKITSTVVVPCDPFKTNVDMDQFILKPSEKGNTRTRKCKTQNKTIRADSPPSKPAPPPVAAKKLAFNPDEVNELPLTPVFSEDVLCKKCAYSTKVRSNMIRHLFLHSNEISVPSAAPVNPVPSSGPKHFDSMSNLALSSNLDKPPVLKISTERQERLKLGSTVNKLQNIPAYIPKKERFVCGARGCSYISVDELMLRHHWEALHNEETVFKCAHCAQEIWAETGRPLTTGDIGDHLVLHKATLYQCDSCNFLHSQVKGIERHVNEGNCSGGTPKLLRERRAWQCEICSTRTVLKSEIVQHCRQAHNVQNQFKCSLCLFYNPSRDQFNDHFRKNHSGRTVDVVSMYSKGQEPFDVSPLWWKQRKRGSGFIEEVQDKQTPVTKKSRTESPTAAVKLAAKETEPPVPQAIHYIINNLHEMNSDIDVKPVLEVLGTFSTLPEPMQLEVVEAEMIQADVMQTEPMPVEIIQAEPIPAEPVATASLKYPWIMQKLNLVVELPGKLFRCLICSEYTSKSISGMRTHLYEEINYRKWCCDVCNYKSFDEDSIVDHCMQVHRIKKIKELPPDSSVEDWVEKNLCNMKNVSTVETVQNTLEPGPAETLSASNIPDCVSNTPTTGDDTTQPICTLIDVRSLALNTPSDSAPSSSTNINKINFIHSDVLENSHKIIYDSDKCIDTTDKPSDSSFEAPKPRARYRRGSGKNIFGCGHCPFETSRKQYVRRHSKNRHDGLEFKLINLLEVNAVPIVPPPDTPVKTPSPVPSRHDKNFMCLVCEKSFINIEVDQHHKSCHPTEVNQILEKKVIVYKCQLCMQLTADMASMRVHFDKLHPEEDQNYVMHRLGSPKFKRILTQKGSPVNVETNSKFHCRYCRAFMVDFTTLLDHHQLNHFDELIGIIPSHNTSIEVTGEITTTESILSDLYDCKISGCNYTSEFSQDYLFHIRSHYVSYFCDICFVHFVKYSSYTNHKSEHANMQIKPKFAFLNNFIVRRRLRQIIDMLEKVFPSIGNIQLDSFMVNDMDEIPSQDWRIPNDGLSPYMSVAESCTTVYESPNSRLKQVARKSTTHVGARHSKEEDSTSASSKEYSNYGKKPDTNFKNITTKIQFMSSSTTLTVDKLSEFVKLFPVVLVKDYRKNK